MIILRVCSVYGAPALLRVFRVHNCRRVATAVLGENSSDKDKQYPTTMSTGSATKKAKVSSIANCHLQVLGTGGGELKPCLFLFTDSKRYLFNCVENVQRFSNEYKVRQGKLHNFFITRMTWDNVGGLPGQSLHFANFFDAQLRSPIQLHGPDSLSDLVFSSRFHISPDKIQLETNKVSEAVGEFHLPVYSDENLTVHTLNLQPSSLSAPDSSTDSELEEEVAAGPDNPPKTKRKKVSRAADSTSVFLCKLSDVPGKFNPQKAADLGLPKGPQYRALVSGQSVTAPNGNIIHPKDVLGPTRIGPSFIVLECPHEGYVSSIVGHLLLQRESFTTSGQRVALIVHMSPRAVVENDAYCQWMASFGPHTKHLLLHETLCPHDWALRGFLKTHAPLNLLQPSLFTRFSKSSVEIESTESLKILQYLPHESIIIGKTLLQYHLKPSQREGIDETHVLEPFGSYWDNLMERVRASPDIRKALEKVPKSEISEKCATSPSSVDDVSVTFLGTGASCPSKYRNVSGILLQSSSGNVLLDCGEGTLAQLYRHFGSDNGNEILANLGQIFISHIHGDHNLGVVSLLHRRAEILQRKGSSGVLPTYVLGPRKVLWWLKDYSRRCQKLYYRFVDCSSLTERECAFGALSFQTVPVIHCKESYGVVVSCEGRRIVFSGDTRPCPALTRLGRNATLLLHEATLEDGMLEDAKEKKHCTISEALQIAEQMNPDFTILTHFSQRYCKFLPVILSKKGDLKSKVFTAFDHMTVTLSDMHNLPSLLPAVQDILACTKDEDEAPITWGW